MLAKQQNKTTKSKLLGDLSEEEIIYLCTKVLGIELCDSHPASNIPQESQAHNSKISINNASQNNKGAIKKIIQPKVQKPKRTSIANNLWGNIVYSNELQRKVVSENMLHMQQQEVNKMHVAKLAYKFIASDITTKEKLPIALNEFIKEQVDELKKKTFETEQIEKKTIDNLERRYLKKCQIITTKSIAESDVGANDENDLVSEELVNFRRHPAEKQANVEELCKSINFAPKHLKKIAIEEFAGPSVNGDNILFPHGGTADFNGDDAVI